MLTDMIHDSTFAQWVIAIFSGGTFVAALSFLVRWRALSIGAEQILRTHFGEELKRLTEQVRECEKDKSEMRAEMSVMQDEITGLKRQIAYNSADKLTILEGKNCPTDTAPEAAKSARRVKRITEDGE